VGTNNADDKVNNRISFDLDKRFSSFWQTHNTLERLLSETSLWLLICALPPRVRKASGFQFAT